MGKEAIVLRGYDRAPAAVAGRVERGMGDRTLARQLKKPVIKKPQHCTILPEERFVRRLR